jgi:GAF domain-containing protein
MRWFVEISPLGKSKGDATKLCVEASEWQSALQQTRALRGDEGPISGFSIELLDDGYRAVDPGARLKYLVRKAPEDAELVPATPTAKAEALPAHEVLSQRSEDPTPRSPLTYREAAFSVAPSTSEAEVERLLRAKLDRLKTELAASRPGTRFVSLAVFDHVFKQRPERPPVATLLWKDWRGDAAEVRFAPPPAPAPAKVASVPPPVAAPAPAKVASVPPPVAAPAPTKAASVPPPAAAPAKVASVPPPAAAPAKVASVPRPEPGATKAKAAASVKPAISDAPKSMRFSGEELISELFEACGDLHFVQDTLAGAEFILALTLDKLPSQAGIVSLFDMNKREFVVVRQTPASGSALLQRIPERTAAAATAMRSHHAVVIADASGGEHAKDARWAALGVEPKSLICAPVELNGRYLGLIELANPLDGKSYSASDGHALTYIGQQFAEFVASHGVVLDPELIQEAPLKKGRTR